MSKISKFVKLDKNVLLEYIYDEGNLIGEAYDILVNSKDKKRSYVAASTSATNNTGGNQLFILDNNTRRLGKINSTSYSFLEIKNFSSAAPIRHDKLRFHLPINWTFGEYLGFYIKVYGFDSQNLNKYEISNYYFDMTDVSQSYMMNFTSPPLLFQEKLWGKNIQIEIPALGEISSQLTMGLPTDNSLNANITNGAGFSLSSPIFLEFSFITSIQTINGVTTYLSTTPLMTSIPQTPEFERLGLMIEDSPNGDFFEIYGTYNGTIADFNKFINDSISKGNRYYVQYNITIYEQNIRGKTTTYTVTDAFNETIEYRPIIKFSTTTAIIDVEMRLIDQVDESYIIRRASYGMLQDEVSKYSTNLMKINLARADKPKIYNIKTAVNPSLVGISNSMGSISVYNSGKSSATPRSSFQNSNSMSNSMSNSNRPVTEVVRVPYPVLIDRFNIMAKSENSMIDSKNFYGFGKIIVNLYPFDNVLKFILATGTAEAPKYFDLTSFSELKFVIRNDDINIDFPLYNQPDNDLTVGNISFKLTQSKYADIKKIYNRGVNVFYITGVSQDTTSVIYTGLFKPYDNTQSVAELNDQAKPKPDIILDPTAVKETAVVFRKPIKEMAPVLKPNKLKDSMVKLAGSGASLAAVSGASLAAAQAAPAAQATPATKNYTVKKMFFVKELANIVGMKLDDFIKLNGIKNAATAIKIGTVIKVDGKSNFTNKFIEPK